MPLFGSFLLNTLRIFGVCGRTPLQLKTTRQPTHFSCAGPFGADLKICFKPRALSMDSPRIAILIGNMMINHENFWRYSIFRHPPEFHRVSIPNNHLMVDFLKA